jgi:DNA-binding NtrC family response regulator
VPGGEGVAHRQSGTVLVVDDEEYVRRVAELFLRLAGFHVLTASSGIDALRVYQEHAGAIDVVLLDLTVPDLSGEAVFQKLREQSPHLPVILTSGYAEDVMLRQFTGPEPPAFLHKPYRGEDLTGKVRAIHARTQRAQRAP